MKFRYTGDCEDFSFRGLDFPIGESVEVEDEETIRKCIGNSHYSEVKERKTKAKKVAKVNKTKVVEDGDSGGDPE